jgi:death-on-curing protein
MPTYKFLEIGDVLDLHDAAIVTYGGSVELRDQGLLESALAVPRSTFGSEYLHRDVYEVAAAYLYHIVQNHPFVDGNKRTGFATCFAFLYFNGLVLCADQMAAAELTENVAKGLLAKPQVAEFLRAHCQPRA